MNAVVLTAAPPGLECGKAYLFPRGFTPGYEPPPLRG